MKLALEQPARHSLCEGEMSIRELRTMFGTCNKRSWYRLIADMKDITITQHSTPPNPFKIIHDCLEAFRAITKEMLY